jgi:hypothetical protein
MGKQIPSALTAVFAVLPTPYRPGNISDINRLQRLLDEFIAHIAGFPPPCMQPRAL